MLYYKSLSLKANDTIAPSLGHGLERELNEDS